MGPLKHVVVRTRPLEVLSDALPEDLLRQALDAGSRARAALAGRAIWSVSSTMTGGGVAEMLHTALAYTRGAGVDARWVVIRAQPDFFTITKRIHNQLHGFAGDGGGLGPAERAVYERTAAFNGTELAALVRAGDLVILHDPQTAGLIPHLKPTGVRTVWRSHIGSDAPNGLARSAQAFLEPYVSAADAYVFSRAEHAWESLDPGRVMIIPPAIDPLSPKNQAMEPGSVLDICRQAGLVAGDGSTDGVFLRMDGTPGRVDRTAAMVEVAPPDAQDKLVVVVSRWDRLKDPVGTMQGFARCNDASAHLVFAGPDVTRVSDDPEGATVHGEAVAAWDRLPEAIRRRVHLASVPIVDPDENAAIINALQRHATIVVQKSLAEGFGLTVSEAMWKGRPVIASRIGGIQDQVVHGETGLLLDDPTDLDAFAAALDRLLADGDARRDMGAAGHQRVLEEFLVTRQLQQHADLMERLAAGEVAATA
jgi:trehalose synthase